MSPLLTARALSAGELLRAANDAAALCRADPSLPAELASNAALCAAGTRLLGLRRWRGGAAVLRSLTPAEIAALARRIAGKGLLCTACLEGLSLKFSESRPDSAANPNFDNARFEELKNR